MAKYICVVKVSEWKIGEKTFRTLTHWRLGDVVNSFIDKAQIRIKVSCGTAVIPDEIKIPDLTTSHIIFCNLTNQPTFDQKKSGNQSTYLPSVFLLCMHTAGLYSN